MVNKTMAEITAFFRRNDLPQSHLHLLRILDAVNQTDTVRQTDTVCVCHDRRFAKDIS